MIVHGCPSIRQTLCDCARMSKYQANNIGIIGLIQSLISEQNVDRIRLYFLDLQSNQAICNAKNVDGVQQTVLEKTADSFKLA